MVTFTVNSTRCCGLVELSNISALPSPEAVIMAVGPLLASLTDQSTRFPAFLLFTGVVGERQRVYATYLHADRSDDYGSALAAYIKEHNLGTVTETEAARNHSGNMLKVWVWAPKWDVLKALWLTAKTAQSAAAATPSSLSVNPF